ncbi:hypothetical protein CIB93_00795 [Streptomyces sp. WZ.A104]|uniref:hypothetical protein n=1 Tax=Streptomyces sp. WZ.A104 TaxID=2023771 RepID=UPI000BBBB373|nr:hypothetical protein [Streptomyces sp. WZ.A104]PCG87998.1 hypothetical protein CIB93_00795 [Streptomyces sp. WZ.A104]
MTVTWRGALSYALTVTVVSWLVGLGVELALLVLSDGHDDWSAGRAADPWELVFPVAAVVALTAARRFLQPLPRWRVIVTDGLLYTAVLLLCGGITAWATGDEAPVDSAFVTGIFALFSLQLPAAWGLSGWRSGNLEVVVAPALTAEQPSRPTS